MSDVTYKTSRVVVDRVAGYKKNKTSTPHQYREELSAINQRTLFQVTVRSSISYEIGACARATPSSDYVTDADIGYASGQ